MDGDARTHQQPESKRIVDDMCAEWRARLQNVVDQQRAEFQDQEDLRPGADFTNEGLTTDGLLPMPGGRRATICKECVRGFKQNDVPPAALVRGNWPGVVPDELAILNRTELSMIALINPITHVTMLPEAKAQAWHSVKGKSKVFSVVNDVAQFVQLLPRMPTVDSMAIFVNKNCKAPQDLGFRPQRVVDAFDWLKRHNHLYQDVEFDPNFRELAARTARSNGGDEGVQLPPVLEVDDDEHQAMEEAVAVAAQTAMHPATSPEDYEVERATADGACAYIDQS